jgi:hypothetical protein
MFEQRAIVRQSLRLQEKYENQSNEFKAAIEEKEKFHAQVHLEVESHPDIFWANSDGASLCCQFAGPDTPTGLYR